MNNNDIEKELKAQAKQVKVRAFDEIWQDVRSEIEEPNQREKRRIPTWVRAITVAMASVILLCVIAFPITVNIERNRVYAYSDLIAEEVTENDFYKAMKRARIDVVDVSEFYHKTYLLYTAKNGAVKGGEVTFSNKEKFRDYFITVSFFNPKISVEHFDSLEYINTIEINDLQFYQTEHNFTIDGGGELTSYLKGEYKQDQCFIKLGIVAYAGDNGDALDESNDVQTVTRQILDQIF